LKEIEEGKFTGKGKGKKQIGNPRRTESVQTGRETFEGAHSLTTLEKSPRQQRES